MLGKLFGSNARVKILKLFLSQPDKKFYIRQISRDLKLQLNSVRRELENLEKFGLLVSKTGVEEIKDKEEDLVTVDNANTTIKEKVKTNQPSKTEKKFFQVNKNFVLYEEIKALIIKAQVLYEKDFVNKLDKSGNIKLLILTGYFVNDQASPIDMLIVGRVNKVQFIKLMKDLEIELGREINYTLFSNQEYKYRRDMTDIFLYGILEGRKILAINEVGVS